MVPPPETVRRHFLSWDEPLLPQAVAFLVGKWPGDRALDLSAMLVVVPTRQSGRRLREGLASFAAKRGQAVFSPLVLTPHALLAQTPETGVASRLESLLAWAEVLRDLDLEEFRDVFPIDPPERSFSWAVRLGREFARLQKTLAETGLRLAQVADRAGDNFPEAARWSQIGQLERRQVEKLAALGLRDAQDITLAQVESTEISPGIERVVVIGTPDPMPLALAVLAKHARQVPLDVVVFAPNGAAELFDGWGRPVAAAWSARDLVLPEFEQRVHLCADPAAQANRVVALARDYRDPAGVLGVGVADAEVLPLLEAGLRHEGFEAFNPEGRSHRGDGLFQLLSALSVLARNDSFAGVEFLARCPDFLEFLQAKFGGDFSAAKFLTALDRLHANYLPPSLAEAQRHRPDSRELEVVAELRRKITTGKFPENVAGALAEIFASRQFDLSRAADTLTAAAAEAWSGVMREIAGAVRHFAEVADADWWEMALLLYGESERSDDKPDGAIELQGWLELLWEDAPHLIVTGLNDGLVPEAVVGDAFLPEGLRERLGLKTNAERFARDAYLLQALAAARTMEGRLDLLCGRNSVAGDPLRPSRLLLRCADAELPRRVDFLFRPIEGGEGSPPWQRAWKLVPRQAPVLDHVSVTALKKWLECPFRFYLSRVLRMEPVDPAKVELDAMDFGTLCHAALEAMGRDEGMRDSVEPAALRKFLLSELERTAAKRFGRQHTLPLVIQLESARQRLSRVADVQAEARQAGWKIEQVETPFEIEVNGLNVRGKIDRIDRNELTGAVRVLDYKTSDRPVSPMAAHLTRTARFVDVAPDFARWMDGDVETAWQDLQLPMYLRALAGKFPGEISCGYFNLPKASGETNIALWEGFTPELRDSAWRCAEGIAGAIRSGNFWPPNENLPARSDDFASLFHHGVADSVDWKGAKP